MKVVDLSTRKLNKMPKLQISDRILNTEGILYIYNHKDKWNYLKELIKIYYHDEEEFIADKVYILSQLLVTFENIDIKELVLPTSLVAVDGNIRGFSMPYIENNVNAKLILNNERVSLEDKIKYLKMIYEILEKIRNIKELEDKFYLADIHESNFIFDIDEQMMKAVDLDSSYINNSSIGIHKFLIHNEKLLDNPLKYPLNEEDRPIPNNNTTILSFIYLLLNALSNSDNSHRWSMNEFYNYVSFLKENNISNELLDSILNIYSKSTSNEFSESLLDEIDVKVDYSLKRARIPKSSTGYY